MIPIEAHDVLRGHLLVVLDPHRERIVVGVAVGIGRKVQAGRHQVEDAPNSAVTVVWMVSRWRVHLYMSE